MMEQTTTKMNSEFSLEEIDTLIESMDSWLSRDSSTELMMGLLDATMRKNDGMTPDEWSRQQERKMDDRRRAKAAHKSSEKETASIIKAKLYMLRRGIDR